MYHIGFHILNVSYCVLHLKCIAMCITLEIYHILYYIWNVLHCVSHLKHSKCIASNKSWLLAAPTAEFLHSKQTVFLTILLAKQSAILRHFPFLSCNVDNQYIVLFKMISDWSSRELLIFQPFYIKISKVNSIFSSKKVYYYGKCLKEKSSFLEENLKEKTKEL